MVFCGSIWILSNFFLLCEERDIDFDWDYTESVNSFWKNGYFHNINSTNPYHGISFHFLVFLSVYSEIYGFHYRSLSFLLFSLFVDVFFLLLYPFSFFPLLSSSSFYWGYCEWECVYNLFSLNVCWCTEKLLILVCSICIWSGCWNSWSFLEVFW